MTGTDIWLSVAPACRLHRMTRSLAIGSVLLPLLFSAVTASAQEATPPPESEADRLDEAARITFESAREAFVAGDYETALARFRQAYELSPRPGLLYNIAQSLDRLRRDEETLQALRDYLAAAPQARNRAEVEARIAVLESNPGRRAPPPPPDNSSSSGTATRRPDPPPSDPLAILHPAIFIATAGAALVVGGLAVWTGLETISLNDRYNAATDYNDALALYNDADTFQLLTNIFIFSAGGLGAAAVVFAVLTDWSVFTGGSGSASNLRPTFGLGSVGLEGSF